MPGEMDALLPCPICRKAPKVRQFEKYAEIFCYHVEGDPDEDRGGLIVEARCDTLEQARAAWNRRSAVTAPAVKGLEWRSDGSAEPVRWYGIPAVGHTYVLVWSFHGQRGEQWSFGDNHYSSLDEAKAAAQADYASRIMAALEPIPPSGDFVLVPREPTEAMLRAGIDNCALSIQQDRAGHRQMTTPFEDECGSIYRAMLAAAPSPTSLLEPGAGETKP